MNKIFISTLIVAASTFSNVALSAPLIQPTPAPSPAPTPGTGTPTGTTSGTLSAVDDYVHVVPVQTPSVSGNVTINDKGFVSAYLQSSPVGKYGYLDFSTAGVFTYTLSGDLNVLNGRASAIEQFQYAIQSGSKTAKATLTVTIFANQVSDEELESNDTSDSATTLRSGQMIKGNLYAPNDKDWYTIGSLGDEVIHIEVCAKGSVCFGKKSWVMYVFDGSKLTPDMENATVELNTYRNDTGAILSSQSSKDMYLAYNAHVFQGALISIVDPCFDTTNSVDVGVPPLKNTETSRKYYIAMGVPLKRDGTGCSDGSVVLKKPGFSIVDSGGKDVQTTQEYISYYPNSDDEYALKVSHTGNAPGGGLAPSSSAGATPYASSLVVMPSFNEKQHLLTIPKLRIFNDLYSASLSYKGSLIKMIGDPNQVVTMALKKITGIQEDLSGDPYQATFEPKNDQVVLSTMRNSHTGETYSAKLQYHPSLGKKPLWLEVLSISPTQ